MKINLARCQKHLKTPKHCNIAIESEEDFGDVTNIMGKIFMTIRIKYV